MSECQTVDRPNGYCMANSVRASGQSQKIHRRSRHRHRSQREQMRYAHRLGKYGRKQIEKESCKGLQLKKIPCTVTVQSASQKNIHASQKLPPLPPPPPSTLTLMLPYKIKRCDSPNDICFLTLFCIGNVFLGT